MRFQNGNVCVCVCVGLESVCVIPTLCVCVRVRVWSLVEKIKEKTRKEGKKEKNVYMCVRVCACVWFLHVPFFWGLCNLVCVDLDNRLKMSFSLLKWFLNLIAAFLTV